MKSRLLGAAAVALIVLAGSPACEWYAPPGELFAEADALRLQFQRDASQRAAAKFERAMVRWEGQGRLREAATAGQHLARTHEQLGSLRRALKDYEAAAALARRSSDQGIESEIRSDLGVTKVLIAAQEREFEEAHGECQAALRLAEAGGDRARTARALNCLGEVAYYRQQPERALDHYRQAGSLWDALGDRRGQAQTSLYQGYVSSDLSRFEDARRHYERARSLRAALGDRRDLAIILVADARLQARRGEYQPALNTFQEALALLRPSGDAVWEGSCLTGIARVHLDMGETDEALEYWEQALALFEQAGLRTVAVETLMSLGDTYLAAGDDTRALNRFTRALSLAERLGVQRSRAWALRHIGVLHLFRRMPEDARRYLERSLRLQGAGGAPRVEMRTRADLGDAHLLLGDSATAVRHFERALALSRTFNDRVVEARSLFGLARAAVRVNDLPAARGHIERSWTVAESIRTTVDNRDLRASYFASVHHYNEFYIDLLMRQHRASPGAGLAARAFEMAERARARSLLESLTDARVDLRHGLDADLAARERALNQAFEAWGSRQRRLSRASPESERERLSDEYRELETEYHRLESEMRRRSPRHAALVRPVPLRLRDVQEQVLDDDTLLLEYALGEERSFLWAVSTQQFVSHELPPRAAIEGLAQRVYDLLTARLRVPGDAQDGPRLVAQADGEFQQEAARLSAVLLGPVARMMAGRRILVVGDGILQYLPFAALPEPAVRTRPVPLIENHEVINVPSASVLAVMRGEAGRRVRPAGTVAVIADPVFERDDPRLARSRRDAATPSKPAAPAGASAVRATGGLAQAGSPWNPGLTIARLAATRAEAEAIVAAARGGRTFRAVDFDANRRTAMGSELAQYRIVHFATHSILDNEDPSRAGIVLSLFDRTGQPQDGFLRLHDIYRLRLPADLVVLSACNTALGRPVKGEGLVGMVRGFMYGGAQRVVASLWNVEDDATGALMARFYDELLRQQRAPAAALRRAQLAVRQDARTAAPFFWAAFVLQGDWR